MIYFSNRFNEYKGNKAYSFFMLLIYLWMMPVVQADVITTILGDGTVASTGDGGLASVAQTLEPVDVAVDSSGNLYIAELSSSRIRKIDKNTNIINTVVGNGIPASTGDGGLATAAQINMPFAIAFDNHDNLYIAEWIGCRIRKVDSNTGIISTVAGDGTMASTGDGGLATAAQINFPAGIVFDSNNNLYIAEEHGHRIRKVDNNTSIISTVIGDGTMASTGDGGQATAAQIRSPRRMVFDSSDNLYIVENSGYRVRKVDNNTGIISTVAGNGTSVSSGDGGLATVAQLNAPTGLTVDNHDNLYITEAAFCIRKINNSTGIINTVVGNGTQGSTGDGGPAIATQLDNPYGIIFDDSGHLYITEMVGSRIRKVTPSAPAAPTSLTATAVSQTQIDLSWTDASDNESGFKIEQPAGTLIHTTAANVTHYSHTGLSCNTTYDYEVKATNGGGDSAAVTISATTQACPPPVAPTSLTATAASQTQIDLSWTDMSNNEIGFKIEQPAGTLIHTTAANVTYYNHTGLTCNTTYDYEVKATNAGGDSAAAIISATTQACRVPTPKETPKPALTVQPISKPSTSNTYILPPTMGVSVEIWGNGHVKSEPGGLYCQASDCEKTHFVTDPTGLQCNNSCKQRFDTATRVTLTPTPTTGYIFSGWGGHKDCVDNQLFLSGHRLCIAYFRAKPNLSTATSGTTGTSLATTDSTMATSQTLRLVNLSTRAQIRGNAKDVIVGFIIRGKGNQKVMLRGMALESQVDPVLTLQTYPTGEIIATNNNWVDNSNNIPVHLQPSNVTDAGLLLDLPVGAYTATLYSNKSNGIGLISVDVVDGSLSSSQLINMSSRASIQGGANDVITGFILKGTGTQKIMVSGLGLEEGVDTKLVIQTYPDGIEIAQNDNWKENAQIDNIPEYLKLPQTSDAGLLLDLPAGAYTAILSSNGATGLGLISVDKVE